MKTGTTQDPLLTANYLYITGPLISICKRFILSYIRVSSMGDNLYPSPPSIVSPLIHYSGHVIEILKQNYRMLYISQ